MAEATFTIRVSIAWWLWPYLDLLCFFCWVMDREPDEEKLERTILRALRVRHARG